MDIYTLLGLFVDEGSQLFEIYDYTSDSVVFSGCKYEMTDKEEELLGYEVESLDNLDAGSKVNYICFNIIID